MALADQVPTASPFAAKTNGVQVIANLDLTGRTAVVTGGYSGIGLETVRALAARGAAVIVPVRTPAKAEADLRALSGDITTHQMDLADLASVRAFATAVASSRGTLDLLINNAGIMACPERRVGPVWESQFGVNHMGHFALTTALLPLLQNTPGARVVALSSTAHKLTGIRWDDVQFEQGYDKWVAYGQAKTANALFANALSRGSCRSGCSPKPEPWGGPGGWCRPAAKPATGSCTPPWSPPCSRCSPSSLPPSPRRPPRSCRRRWPGSIGMPPSPCPRSRPASSTS